MHAFTDTKGRQWQVDVNVASIKRVRQLLGHDLYKLIEDGMKPLSALLGDPIGLVDVLYVLCKDAADEAQVGDEEFGRALAGDPFAAATDAFLESYTDFFPDAKVRANLRKVWAKATAVQGLAATKMGAALDRLEPEAVLQTWSDSAGNSPASAASTPAP